MKYITRFDHSGSRGWWVRIILFHSNINIQKLFTDNKFGGNEKAFLAANVFKKKALQDLKDRHIKPGRIAKTYHENSPGIRRIIKKPYGYAHWIGSFYERAYKRTDKSFSVNKYGERKAKALAIEARRKGVIIAKKRREDLIKMKGEK